MRICSGCVSDTELEKEVEFVRDPLSSWLDSKVREAMLAGRMDSARECVIKRNLLMCCSLATNSNQQCASVVGLCVCVYVFVCVLFSLVAV